LELIVTVTSNKETEIYSICLEDTQLLSFVPRRGCCRKSEENGQIVIVLRGQNRESRNSSLASAVLGEAPGKRRPRLIKWGVIWDLTRRRILAQVPSQACESPGVRICVPFD
jgi:hypothetical protein